MALKRNGEMKLLEFSTNFFQKQDKCNTHKNWKLTRRGVPEATPRTATTAATTRNLILFPKILFFDKSCISRAVGNGQIRVAHWIGLNQAKGFYALGFQSICVVEFAINLEQVEVQDQIYLWKIWMCS